MHRFIELFESELNRFIEFIPTLLYAIAAFLMFYALGKIISLSFDRVLSRKHFSGTHRFFLKTLPSGSSI